MTEFADFATMWEQRLISMAEPYLDPKPKFIEGSGEAEWNDETAVVVVVNPGAEDPPRSGYYRCEVVVQYDQRGSVSREAASKTWGQILEAFGDGANGTDKLIDRLRVDPGRTLIPGGVDAVMYDGDIRDDGQFRELRFTAHLGISNV